MAGRLQDFKLAEQDTRLVLFGSTVFKIKCRASPELREVVGTQSSRERDIQIDLKRITAAILSQVVKNGTLPFHRTDTIAVYTDDCPWTACGNLYFAHGNQPLSVHPRVILMMVSLPPPPPPLSTLGKHKREVVTERTGEDSLSHDGCRAKRIRTEYDETETKENSSFVPDPSVASLPAEGGRVAPETQVVRDTAEQSMQRLHHLSQPCWTGAVIGLEEEEGGEGKEESGEQDSKAKKDRSLFQYVKSFFGWS